MTTTPPGSPAAAPVTPDQVLALDAILTEDERITATTVREMLDDHVRPNIGRWYLDGSLPARELTKLFGDLGLLGMHLNGYGCAGTTAGMYGVACRELEAVDGGIRSLVSVQGSLAMYAIRRPMSRPVRFPMPAPISSTVSRTCLRRILVIQSRYCGVPVTLFSDPRP